MQEAGKGQSASPNGLTHGMRLLTLGEGANAHPAALSTHKRHTEKRRRRQQETKETIRSFLKGRRFENWPQIEEAVKKATAYWNAHKHPFVWGRGSRHQTPRCPRKFTFQVKVLRI